MCDSSYDEGYSSGDMSGFYASTASPVPARLMSVSNVNIHFIDIWKWIAGIISGMVDESHSYFVIKCGAQPYWWWISDENMVKVPT